MTKLKQGPMTVTIPEEKAGLTRRLASLVYDGFLLFAIALLYAAVLLSVRILLLGLEAATNHEPNLPSQWLGFIGLYASLSGYYYVCWRKQGQTLGMKSWRIKLQDFDGQLASPSQCMRRCFFAIPSLACGGLGFFWCLLPPNRACWHDMASATEVIMVAKQNT
jgi:uncharacterized RDD family membrane protein YckC